MVNTEALDSELRDIGWHRFNFSWCTGYYPKRYRKILDFLIHKYLNEFRPICLRYILPLNTGENLHNKHLGNLTMRKSEELDTLDPEQYGSRKEKAMYIQALNTRLFYDLIITKRVPATSTFSDIVSN